MAAQEQLLTSRRFRLIGRASATFALARLRPPQQLVVGDGQRACARACALARERGFFGASDFLWAKYNDDDDDDDDDDYDDDDDDCLPKRGFG